MWCLVLRSDNHIILEWTMGRKENWQQDFKVHKLLSAQCPFKTQTNVQKASKVAATMTSATNVAPLLRAASLHHHCGQAHRVHHHPPLAASAPFHTPPVQRATSRPLSGGRVSMHIQLWHIH